MTVRDEMVRLVNEIMALPYVWPTPPDADSARRLQHGSCASKHALLAEELARLGVASRPMFVAGPLVPEVMATDPVISEGLGLLEVHELLTISVPDVGPVQVDITWDPPLVARGLPGTLAWDGQSDTPLAIGGAGTWVPDPSRLREEKEALRSRIYRGDERATRDKVLTAMSETFAAWRAQGSI